MSQPLTGPGGVFTLDELRDIKASLELGRRDNFSPVLAAVALILVGLRHHADWTDAVCIIWGVSQLTYFTHRHFSDRAIHKRAKTILDEKRHGPTQ